MRPKTTVYESCDNLRRIRKVGRKDRLQTRQIDNRFKELMLKSENLNRMTRLGMPDSVKVVG